MPFIRIKYKHHKSTENDSRFLLLAQLNQHLSIYLSTSVYKKATIPKSPSIISCQGQAISTHTLRRNQPNTYVCAYERHPLGIETPLRPNIRKAFNIGQFPHPYQLEALSHSVV